jgi:nitroreductase
MSVEECTAIKKELLIDHEQAVQFLRSRRSARQFQDKPVEKDKILRLIEIARYAPTSGNTQLVEWAVFTDRNQLKNFSRLTVNYLREMLREAPRSAIPPYVPRVVSAWDNPIFSCQEKSDPDLKQVVNLSGCVDLQSQLETLTRRVVRFF